MPGTTCPYVEAIPSKEAQNLALHESPGKCLPGPHYTPHMGYSGLERAIPGLLKGPNASPWCGQKEATDKLCPAPKVTFPAPSSDGCLNNSFSTFGAQEGRQDPWRP